VLSKSVASKLSGYLTDYASQKGIYVKINYVNPDHVHMLVDLPTPVPTEEIMQLLKGSSSHWINEKNLLPCKFAWGRGYGAFLSLIQGLVRWLSTLRRKRNIIARKASPKS